MIYESKEIEGFPWVIHITYRALQDNWSSINKKYPFSYMEKTRMHPEHHKYTDLVWQFHSGAGYTLYFKKEDLAIRFATAVGML